MPAEAFEVALDRLVRTQQESDYQPGWVLVALASEGFDFSTFSPAQWNAIGVALEYGLGWAHRQWIDHKPQSEPIESLQETLERLIAAQESCDYQPAWVMNALSAEGFEFSTFTKADWNFLAEQLGYKSGWAWHQHQQYATV